MTRLAGEAGALAIEIVDVAGNVDAISEVVSRQAEDFQGLLRDADEVSQSNARIGQAVSQPGKVAEAAAQDVAASRKAVTEAVGEIHALVEAVGSIQGQLGSLQEALGSVAEVASGIDAIAKQTNLLALNATIEAARIGAAFEQALAEGQITEAALFSHSYTPLPVTDPAQVMAPFTELTDALLPANQEPVLELDPKVVFCAAVDLKGYLPTHNLKFSKPQGNDPVWNAVTCRNRRIFDDRGGLKTGRNEKPFLLQAYRRDMGGGTWAAGPSR